jgi:hypothetical protein
MPTTQWGVWNEINARTYWGHSCHCAIVDSEQVGSLVRVTLPHRLGLCDLLDIGKDQFLRLASIFGEVMV